MILSNIKIHEVLDRRWLRITPEPVPRLKTVTGECPYQTSSVDLRLGNTLELINFGPLPISLYPSAPICQLIIEQVHGVPFRNDSQFQNQTRAGGVA